MPEGSGESFLGWVLYAFVVYWIASNWYAHVTRLEVTEDVLNRRERSADVPPAASHDRGEDIGDREALLSEIVRREHIANIDEFLTNALKCYEKIIAALNAGDRETLRGLVSPDVYRAFEQVIAEREAAKTHVETLFACIETPEIVDGTVDASRMEVTVRFIAEAFSLRRNAAGQLTEERPVARRTVDVWTFVRDLVPRRGGWRVVATGQGA